MAYVVRLGESKESAARPKRSSVLAEWRSASAGQRMLIGALLAASLVGFTAVGVQVLPTLRAALFPIASQDLPADADPSSLPTLEHAGVYDRTVPGGVKLSGVDTSAPAAQDDPAERPFQRTGTVGQ